MSYAVTHQRVSDDVSVNGVNRVNRAQGGGARAREERGHTDKSRRQVWSNVEALKGLLARADRELAREPGGYVAVAVVAGDKREEQVGRWGWAGSRDAGGRVAILGNGLVAGARGLRVRVHRERGGLLGSALLRRTTATATPPERATSEVTRPAAVTLPDRLGPIEAELARAVARLVAQERELCALRAALAEVRPLREVVADLEERLVDVEAVAERVRNVESALSEVDDETGEE